MVYHLGLACICAGAGLLYLPLRWDHDFRRLDPLRLECYLVGHQSQDVIREPIESLLIEMLYLVCQMLLAAHFKYS